MAARYDPYDDSDAIKSKPTGKKNVSGCSRTSRSWPSGFENSFHLAPPWQSELRRPRRRSCVELLETYSEMLRELKASLHADLSLDTLSANVTVPFVLHHDTLNQDGSAEYTIIWRVH